MPNLPNLGKIIIPRRFHTKCCNSLFGMLSAGHYDLPKFGMLGPSTRRLKIYLYGWDFLFLASYKPCYSQVPFRRHYKNAYASGNVLGHSLEIFGIQSWYLYIYLEIFRIRYRNTNSIYESKCSVVNKKCLDVKKEKSKKKVGDGDDGLLAGLLGDQYWLPQL